MLNGMKQAAISREQCAGLQGMEFPGATAVAVRPSAKRNTAMASARIAQSVKPGTDRKWRAIAFADTWDIIEWYEFYLRTAADLVFHQLFFTQVSP